MNILHECERVLVLWVNRAAQNSLGVSLGCDPYAQAGAIELGGKGRKSTCSKHMGQITGRVGKEKRKWKKRVLSWQRGQPSKLASKEELPANWIFYKPCYVWGTPRSESINDPLPPQYGINLLSPDHYFPQRLISPTHVYIFVPPPLCVDDSCLQWYISYFVPQNTTHPVSNCLNITSYITYYSKQSYLCACLLHQYFNEVLLFNTTNILLIVSSTNVNVYIPEHYAG